MPRGIPKAKSALARIEAAIESLQPLHKEIQLEDMKLSGVAEEIRSKRLHVQERLRISSATLANLDTMRRSLEEKKE